MISYPVLERFDSLANLGSKRSTTEEAEFANLKTTLTGQGAHQSQLDQEAASRRYQFLQKLSPALRPSYYQDLDNLAPFSQPLPKAISSPLLQKFIRYKPERAVKAVVKELVLPPTVAVAGGYWVFSNPLLAAQVLVAAPAALPLYPTIAKISQKFEDVYDRFEQITAPGPYYETKIKKFERKVLLSYLPGLLFGKIFFKDYTEVDPATGVIYQVKGAFRPTYALYKGTGSWFERRAAAIQLKNPQSIWVAAFTKAGANLKQRRRRSPWAIIGGLVVIDLAGTLVGRITTAAAKKILGQARWLRTSKTLKGAGQIARGVGGGIFSLNTASGALVGGLATAGSPLGITAGAVFGASYQTALNFAPAAARYVERIRYQQALAKAFGTPYFPPTAAQQRLARILRPIAYLEKSKLARLPFKGLAAGVLLTQFGAPFWYIPAAAAAQYGWGAFRPWAFEKVVKTDYATWATKNPIKAKALASLRQGAWGAGIGAALAIFSGQWWLVPFLASTLFAVSFATRSLSYYLSKLLPRFIRPAAPLAAKLVPSGLKLWVAKAIAGLTGVLAPFSLFDLARGIARGGLKKFFADYKTWQSWQIIKGPYWQYWIEKKFLQAVVKVLDVALWPWDKFWSWFFSTLWPVIAPVLKYTFLGLYEAGKFAFSWTTKLPGFLGAGARKIGSFFTGVKEAITGTVKAFVQALLALLGAIISLLTGGSIAEAAVVGAIGLALGGAILNAQTIDSAFVQTPPPSEEEVQFVDLTKTAQTQNPDRGPASTIFLANSDLPQEITFAVRLVAIVNLSNLSCTDQLILIKRDGTTEQLALPPIPACPSEMAAGQEFSFSFRINALNQPRFHDGIIKNIYSVSGNVAVATPPPGIGGDCGGIYTPENSPQGNFGDPACDYSDTGLSILIGQLDAANLVRWFCIATHESGPWPNAWLTGDPNTPLHSPDPNGAWGLFQMDRGTNGPLDHGDVEWHIQTSNAINYNNQVLGGSFSYWQPVLDGRC